MKKISFIIISIVFYLQVSAQDSTKTETTVQQPVKKTFETSYLIDQATVMQPMKGSLEFLIQHRFSPMNNGIKDLFGIYAAANTRLSLNYGIVDWLSLGFGTTQNKKLQDLNWKVSLLRQTKTFSIPVSISYYGNVVAKATNKSDFGDPDKYKFIHRLSYFNQLIIACKFNKSLSMQVAPSVAYFNAIDDSTYSNLNFGLAVGGRAKITKSASVIFEYQQPFTKASNDPKPNASLGLEIGTSTHSFQVFVASYNSIVNQYNLAYNQSDMTTKGLRIGFNITIRL